MNALRLETPERTLAQLYENKGGLRLSRKTVLVVGITTLCYAALGYYFVNQRYELKPYAEPEEPPVIIVEPWKSTPPPLPEMQQPSASAPAPLPVRTPTNVSPTFEDTLPLTPTETPYPDVRPTTADPAPPVADPPAEPAVSAPPGVIRNPVWISRPTPEQVGSLYPQRAIDRGTTGLATLLCGIRANGTMVDCQVIDETPGGWGFGRAALSMARYFKISPKMIDGQAVEGFKVRIPVAFSLPE